GRVYRIGFRADDAQGDRGEGTVTVCVPGMRGPDGCVDQGALFDSGPTCDGTCSGTCVVTSNLESIGLASCIDDAMPSGVSRRITSAHRLLTRLGEMTHVSTKSRLLARASRAIHQAHDLTARADAIGTLS